MGNSKLSRIELCLHNHHTALCVGCPRPPCRLDTDFCPGSLWVADKRFAWFDLTANLTFYGPGPGGKGQVGQGVGLGWGGVGVEGEHVPWGHDNGIAVEACVAVGLLRSRSTVAQPR